MILRLGTYKISISKYVLPKLDERRQTFCLSPEQGGIILGQTNISDILITDITTPTILDVMKRYTFIRSAVSAQEKILDAHMRTEGKTTYMGEWHTHPSKVATPSSQDLRMIKDSFHKNKINVDFIIVIILGNTTDYIGLFDGRRIYSQQARFVP